MSGIRFGRDEVSSYEEGIKREWIIGNGLGGYASSTIIGAGTRTYHGLLVAALENSPDRVLLLSSLDEEISCKDEVYGLATHKYSGTVAPTGFNYLSEFVYSPFPLWVYQSGPFSLKKRVFMVHNSNTIYILYDISSKEEAVLRIFPLVNSRDFHFTSRSGYLSFFQEAKPAGVKLGGSNGFTFWLASNLQYHSDPKWHYNMQYDIEKERGLNFQEDNFNPGYFEGKLEIGDSRFFIAVSTGDISKLSLEKVNELFIRERNRQNLLLLNSKLTEPFALKLLKATDLFVVKNPSSGENTIIAGYHWYADWGRDTMISLPGLLLIPYRFEEARSILSNFANNCRRGLIPNTFPAFGGEPIYNTVDASLWFIHALSRYFAYTQDFLFLSDIWNTIDSIIDSYSKGTDFEISMDSSDYLIRQGPQLTWMDAKVGEWAVTPRAGKACEINALWYNALKTASYLGTLLGKDISLYETLAEGVASNFEPTFWNPEANCLFDLVYQDETGNQAKDPAIRPNQIFAVSLPYTMLSQEKEKAIVDRVKKDLLTPFGLKTLSSDHPLYKGQYCGDAFNRDTAYHNGTVWPWLLGAFVKAYRKVNNYSQESFEEMKALLEGFDANLETAGIGFISEVFDGDYPHTPGGTIAQAWSLAEIFRAYVEDVLQKEIMCQPLCFT